VHLPDPIADAIKALASRIAEVERAVGQLDGIDTSLTPLPPPREEDERVIRGPNRAVGPNPAGG
jgi:hypothetical protein